MDTNTQKADCFCIKKEKYIEMLTEAYREGIRYAFSRCISENEQILISGPEDFQRGLRDSMRYSEIEFKQ